MVLRQIGVALAKEELPAKQRASVPRCPFSLARLFADGLLLPPTADGGNDFIRAERGMISRGGRVRYGFSER